tara:strand:+ start:2445 stop:2567 length:123 start_codon:yes stop_codon:yes gene_type:complete
MPNIKNRFFQHVRMTAKNKEGKLRKENEDKKNSTAEAMEF